MNEETISKVRGVVAEIAKIEDPASVGPEKDIYVDLGVQSTAALDLLLSLEDEFEVQIPDEDFGDARTVSQLAELVTKLVAE
jgi:acyl carrier protein